MRIRLMNDYGNEFPLWGDEGALDPNDLPLQPDLDERLRAWAAGFNVHFGEEHGWPSAEMELAHRAEGERLFAEVRAELPGDEVEFHYWEKSHR